MFEKVLFEKWLEKEKRAAQAKKRKYYHFDPKINIERNVSFFNSFFQNPSNITKHSFYPFLKSEIATPRYKKTGNLKANGKLERVKAIKSRPIAYAAHFDAFIYSWYATYLNNNYESKIKDWEINDCILAYRRLNACNIHFAKEVFAFIKQLGDCVVITTDISGFFDNLDHLLLKKYWLEVINQEKLPDDQYKIYKSVTEFSYVEVKSLFEEFGINFKSPIRDKRICSPREFRERVRKNGLIHKNSNRNNIKGSQRKGQICGIPQGTPISAVLSNIYMIGFDIEVNAKIKEIDGLYRRYCDDIIVAVKPEDVEHAKHLLFDQIKKYELELNSEKTEIIVFKPNIKGITRSYDISDPNKYVNLQYLGFEFNGKNTYVRSSSMSKYHGRMRRRIKENIKAAYGKKSIGEHIFKRKLYLRYTDKGKRNFITYAKRAKEIMNSPTIHKQYKDSIKKAREALDEKTIRFEVKLMKKGKFRKSMKR